MIFQTGTKCFGFTVTRSRYSSEQEGTLVEMTHDQTGAQLCWMDNGSENKTFAVTFKTIPTDSTGVFHILEHSVLCGSEKYPVREPFVELIKSSMNTFLNAMTFSDMTMYPVASRNDRDLMNLAGVYMDAVFAPNILKDANIFRQEGWHIEKDDNGEYTYKGVVFNEMKGAMGEVDRILDEKLMAMMYPDTGYGYNSGGDPACITNLTYEQFIATYQKHYHPTNARIYLDGAVPMEEMLSMIDSYLSRYERSEEKIELGFQTPVGGEDSVLFPIGQEEETENRGRLEIGKIVGTWEDLTRNLAIGVLGDVLTGSNEAPLKQAILSGNLAQDISLGIDDSIAQSFLSISAENVTDGKENEILEVLRKVGKEIQKNGLDRDALEASLNRFAFRLKENEEPQGLSRCIRVMGSWLHDGDPMFFLNIDGAIAELREMAANGGFDQLAAEILLEEENRVILHGIPSNEVNEQILADEKCRLAKVTDLWSEEDQTANAAMKEGLDAWQNTPDTPEALAKLPMLKVEDADQEPEWIETEEKVIDGVRVMFHRIPTHGVVHLNLYFDLTDVSLDELTQLTLLGGLLGRMPTEKHDILKLEQDIKKYTGRMDFFVKIRAEAENAEACTPMLCATASVLEENLDHALELMVEILTTTRFDMKEKINEVVMQCEMAGRQKGAAGGHRIAMLDSLSHFSSEYAAREALDGGSAIRWVHSFATDFEAHYEAFVKLLERVRDESICRSRLTIGLTAQEEKDLSGLIGGLKQGTPVASRVCFRKATADKRAYRIPAQIGFASRGYRLSEMGTRFHGSMFIAASILSLSYLWVKIRVQGGAYGTGFQVDRNGNLFTYSFRDPTPVRTLEADEGFSDFLKEYLQSGEGLDKYIISILNEVNPLLSQREKGSLADSRAMNGATRESVERIRQEILHTSEADIMAFCEQLDTFAKKGAVCVVAHKDALKDCEQYDIMDL